MTTTTSKWRAEDEVLLQRLEDEALIEGLFALYASPHSPHSPTTTPPATAAIAPTAHSPFTGSAAANVLLHSRAAGMISELRKLPNGASSVKAAIDGDFAKLVHFVDALVMKECSPELLHHLALFHSKGATALERYAPDIAANAWVRSLAAWLALAEEHAYLGHLEDAVLGADRKRVGIGATISAADRLVFELVAEIAHRADETARDLGPPGRAALIALARIDEASRIAGATVDAAQRARAEAERRRNAAIESALAVIAEGLDEASVRGELATTGRILLLRAVSVWTWTSNDEAVEHFVVDRLDKIGWELYRARNWDALRYLLDPFRPMIDSLATRIERDPSQIAYAAGAAQMFVFIAEVERHMPTKREAAERAVKVCPSHRNGRLVLASVLCDQAIDAMKAMVVFARRDELTRVERLLERAESLYPTTSELPDAKAMLERVKKVESPSNAREFRGILIVHIMASIERWEHCMVEWYWLAPSTVDPKSFKPSFTLFFPHGKHETYDGGTPELTTFLARLGQDGWHISSSVASTNWILWTLQRRV